MKFDRRSVHDPRRLAGEKHLKWDERELVEMIWEQTQKKD